MLFGAEGRRVRTALPPMRRATLLSCLLLSSTACTYVDQRLTDLSDCFVWRWHGTALGASAEAKVGPIAGALGGW